MLSPDPQRGGEERLILDTARIINSGGVAYFGLDSLTDGMVGSAIGSLILSDLTAVAGDRYNYGVDNRPVNVFVDEAAEVINEPFIQLLNKGRGAGLRLFVATQTFADFAARLGSADKATQVLGNINNIFALRVTDVETQTYITDKIPKTRISTLTHTLGQSTDPHQPVIHSGSQAQMLKEEEADLFAPALLGQLPNLEFIGNISGGKIVKGRIPILTGSKSG
jgi:conjugal transfer pilus assembly protein TraD